MFGEMILDPSNLTCTIGSTNMTNLIECYECRIKYI